MASTINYDVNSCQSLVIGHKYDHKDKVIHFNGFVKKNDDSVVYFKLQTNQGNWMIPLVDYEWLVTQPMTNEAGEFRGQLMELMTVDGVAEYISSSKTFKVTVLKSIKEGSHEVIDPSLDLWAEHLQHLYNDIYDAFERGDFKGEPGDKGDKPVKGIDYFTEEEKNQFASEVSEGARGNFKEIFDADVKLFDAHAKSKQNDFDLNAYNRQNSFNGLASSLTNIFNQNATQKQNAFNTNAARKTQEFDDHVDVRKEEFDVDVEDLREEISSTKEHLRNIDESKADKSELEELQTEVDDIEERLDDIKVDPSIDRRVTNIEEASKDVLYREEVSESEDYQKDVPVGALPYAMLDSIGGKSLVYKQFAKEINATNYLINTDANAKRTIVDGAIRVEPIASTWGALYTKYPIKTTKGMKLYMSIDARVLNEGDTLTLANGGINPITNFGTVNSTTFKRFHAIVTIEGDTDKTWNIANRNGNAPFDAKNFVCFDITSLGDVTLEQCQQIFTADYYPYSEGQLISKDFDSMVIRGKNLLDVNKPINAYPYTNNGITFINNGDGGIKCVGTASERAVFDFATLSKPIVLKNNCTITLSANESYSERNINFQADCYSDGVFIGTIQQPDSNHTTMKIDGNATLGMCRINIPKGLTVDFVYYPMIEYGDSATNYSPYHEESKPISSIITKYFPNGMKSAGSVCDLFDLEHGVAVQNVGNIVLDDSVNYARYTDLMQFGVWYFPINDKKKGGDTILFSDYTVVNGYNNVSVTDKSIGGHISLDKYIYLRDDSITTLQDLKDAMRGKSLYYELIYPITTPIDPQDIALLRDIHVEEGGSITFTDTNDLDIPIPNKETFLVKKEIGGSVDVQINGASIVENGVANIPYGSGSAKGVVSTGNGLQTNSGVITNRYPSLSDLSERHSWRTLRPADIDNAIRLGMTDGIGAPWTEEEQANARERLGIYTVEGVSF